MPLRMARLAPGLLLLATLSFGFSSGCAKSPSGPAFVRASAPPSHRARLYVYRADERSSGSRVRITLDGRDLAALANGEYETLEVSSGPHRLRAGVRSALWVAWGWNEQSITFEPGETLFLEVSVRLTAREQPGGRSIDIAGRQSGAASENVYLKQVGREAAIEALSATTRASDPSL